MNLDKYKFLKENLDSYRLCYEENYICDCDCPLHYFCDDNCGCKVEIIYFLALEALTQKNKIELSSSEAVIIKKHFEPYRKITYNCTGNPTELFVRFFPNWEKWLEKGLTYEDFELFEKKATVSTNIFGDGIPAVKSYTIEGSEYYKNKAEEMRL